MRTRSETPVPHSGENRMRLHSPLCVSPPAWQMHLLSKSWWIYRLNSKSKAHSRSRQRRGRAAASRPPCLAPQPAITHWQGRTLKEASLRIVILTACGAAVMNGKEMLPVFMNISYQQCRNASSFSSFCAIVTHSPPKLFLRQKNFSNCWSLTFSTLVFPFSLLLSQAIGVHFFFTSHLNHLSVITYCSFCCRSLSPFLSLSFF